VGVGVWAAAMPLINANTATAMLARARRILAEENR